MTHIRILYNVSIGTYIFLTYLAYSVGYRRQELLPPVRYLLISSVQYVPTAIVTHFVITSTVLYCWYGTIRYVCTYGIIKALAFAY